MHLAQNRPKALLAGLLAALFALFLGATASAQQAWAEGLPDSITSLTVDTTSVTELGGTGEASTPYSANVQVSQFEGLTVKLVVTDDGATAKYAVLDNGTINVATDFGDSAQDFTLGSEKGTTIEGLEDGSNYLAIQVDPDGAQSEKPFYYVLLDISEVKVVLSAKPTSTTAAASLEFTLSTDGAKFTSSQLKDQITVSADPEIQGIAVSEATVGEDTTEATVTVTGVNKACTLTIGAKPEAFTDTPAPIQANIQPASVTITAPSGNVTAKYDGDDLYVSNPVPENAIITLTATGLQFSKDNGATNISITGDTGLTSTAKVEADGPTATITLSTTPTGSGPVGVKIEPAAFVIQPANTITINNVLTVNPAPTGSITATLNGTLTAGTDVSGQTITLNASGLKFSQSGAVETTNFELQPSDIGVKIESASIDENGVVTLKLADATESTPPGKAASFKVVAKPGAFDPQPAANVTAPTDFYIQDEAPEAGKDGQIINPVITASTTIKAGSSGGEITLTCTGPGTTAFKSSVSATNFVVGVGTTELTFTTAKANEDGTVTLTFTGTAKAGTITVMVLGSAFEDETTTDDVEGTNDNAFNSATTSVIIVASDESGEGEGGSDEPAGDPGTPDAPNEGYVGWGEGTTPDEVGNPNALIQAIEQAEPGTTITVVLPSAGDNVSFTTIEEVPEGVTLQGIILGYPEAAAEGAVTTVYNPTNKTFTLRATADPGYDFVNWTYDGDVVSMDNPWTVTMGNTSTVSNTGTETVSAGAYIATFDGAAAPTTVTVYRLYNKWEGTHLYTTDKAEVDRNVELGWTDEGAYWLAPATAGEGDYTVIRLYNPYSGDHYYMPKSNTAEYELLTGLGWEPDSEASWILSAPEGSDFPVYTFFNPYRDVDTHLYTPYESEAAQAEADGWQPNATAIWAVGLPAK